MMYAIIVIAILVAVAGAVLKTPKMKGIIGEWKVRRKIGKTKEGVQYVLNDVLFDTENKSCQIDHIVINENGVFVIETKNYSGRIYGTDSQQEWTQVLQYGKVKNKLYNPVKQNQTHIYELEKIIGKDTPIKSLIVFVQGNTKYISSKYVCSLKLIKKIIDQPISNTTLSSGDMANINGVISGLKNNSNTTNKQHVKNINQMKEDIANNICPRCGGKLILKKSKYGEFYGCENYPVCKFTKKGDK